MNLLGKHIYEERGKKKPLIINKEKVVSLSLEENTQMEEFIRKCRKSFAQDKK
jgi:hypothetical protein